MASIKISELNEATNLDSNDLLAMVDSIADETKKITFENLEEQIINDKFAILTSKATTAGGSFIIFQYPNGFNVDNCVPINIMNANYDYENNTRTGLWETLTNYQIYGGGYVDVPFATMKNNEIRITDMSGRNLIYKIVLMKIS